MLFRSYFVAIFALPAAFGARAAFYAEPLSDILGPAMTIVVYCLTMKKILQERSVKPHSPSQVQE